MKTEVKWGLITGIGVCLWVLAEYVLGFHGERWQIGQWSGFLSIVIPIVTLTLALRHKRDHELGGALPWGAAIKSGAIISLITGIVTTIFMALYNRVINPGWMEYVLAQQRLQWAADGMSETEIATRVEGYEMLMSETVQIVSGLMMPIVFGIILTVIITFLLRRGHD